ncbi:MAG: glycosyltransferase, partial [Burkholderiales bacterium]|nr:glycosyltransferase [Burkholderiales bacterium]
DFTRQELLGMGVHEQRIVIINPGVDVDRFRPGLMCDDLKASIGLTAAQKLILSVGRLSRRKGFDMMLRSLPELAKQKLDVHFALVGIGEDRDYLSNLAAELGIADRVHFLGHVSPDDLPRWYNACDVFAMPNREINGDTEGFGMVFVEAAACGKPAIAGNAGGTGAAVVEGETGFRVDGTRVDTVADALAQVLGDVALAQRLGRAGYERVCSHFSWASVAQATASLMDARK